jgi:hypothetical protein
MNISQMTRIAGLSTFVLSHKDVLKLWKYPLFFAWCGYVLCAARTATYFMYGSRNRQNVLNARTSSCVSLFCNKGTTHETSILQAKQKKNIYHQDGARPALFQFIFVLFYVLFFCLFCSMFCFFFVLFCSMYCLCVNVYCTTATGCHPNCS